jgi:hypothetical protein
LRGNVARDIPDTGGYGSSAYYLDEQSEGSVVERNLSINVARPLHNHMAVGNIIRDNVFIVNGDARLTFPRCRGYTMEGNVLYATGKIRVENPAAVEKWSRNLFYSRTGKLEGIALNDYASTGSAPAAGAGTVTQDPLFVDRERGDYRYRPGSPALKLGLEPIDGRQAGRRAWRSSNQP